ncbi:hypothetical protein [Phytohabitans aurantiacus]|nr:hypothetical protein [Phytohabitans aurantiacus]
MTRPTKSGEAGHPHPGRVQRGRVEERDDQVVQDAGLWGATSG